MTKTNIEWTDRTWNPIAGCSVISSGCDNCYAMRQAYRIEAMGTVKYQGTTHKNASGRTLWTGKINFDEKALLKPLSWKKPSHIFVNSMSDLFHKNVPDEWIDQVFAVMALCPQHTFQILTKRPERMREYINSKPMDSINSYAGLYQHWDKITETAWPLQNVWLGVSVEDQETANKRIPFLLDTLSAIRFISAEPLLGSINLNRIHESYTGYDGLHTQSWESRLYLHRSKGQTADHLDNFPKLDWVVVGGESGPNARPMHPDWVRSLRDQCQEAEVPYFFKQWGEWAPGECAGGPVTRTEKCATWFNERWDFSTMTAKQNEHLHRDDEPDVYRVGKKKAGHHLDGEVIQQYPKGGE